MPDLTWCIHSGAIRYFRHVHEPANSICFIFLCAFKSTVQYCCYLFNMRSSWSLLARWPLWQRQVTFPLFRFSTKLSDILLCGCNSYCRCEKYACHANRPNYKSDGSAKRMSSFGSVRRVAGPAVCGVKIQTVCDDLNYITRPSSKNIYVAFSYLQRFLECFCLHNICFHQGSLLGYFLRPLRRLELRFVITINYESEFRHTAWGTYSTLTVL